jgi:hypothetical protein
MTDTQGSEASENESLLRLYRKLVHHLRDTRQPASEWWRGHAAEISVLKRKAPRLYVALQEQLRNAIEYGRPR